MVFEYNNFAYSTHHSYLVLRGAGESQMASLTSINCLQFCTTWKLVVIFLNFVNISFVFCMGMVFNLTRISNISISSIGTFTIFWLGLNSWISLKIILCLCITSVLHFTFTQDKTSPICSLLKGLNWVYHVKVESMYAIILYVVKDLRVPNLYQSVQSSKILHNPVSYLLSHPLEAEARGE